MLLAAGVGGLLLICAKNLKKPAAAYFLGGGLLCFSLGDLFYVLHYALRGSITRNFSACDIAWIGTYLFFIGTHQLLEWKSRKASWKSYAMAACTAAVFVFLIISYGNAAINIIWGIPLATLAFCCGKGLDAAGKEEGAQSLRPFYFLLLTFLAADLGLFLSWGIAYDIIDSLLTVILTAMGMAFYRGSRKACT